MRHAGTMGVPRATPIRPCIASIATKRHTAKQLQERLSSRRLRDRMTESQPHFGQVLTSMLILANYKTKCRQGNRVIHVRQSREGFLNQAKPRNPDIRPAGSPPNRVSRPWRSPEGLDVQSASFKVLRVWLWTGLQRRIPLKHLWSFRANRSRHPVPRSRSVM
jgi:hypothetical protein